MFFHLPRCYQHLELITERTRQEHIIRKLVLDASFNTRWIFFESKTKLGKFLAAGYEYDFPADAVLVI